MFRNLARSGNRLATASTRRTQRLYSTAPPKASSGPTFPAMLAVASMGFAAYYTIVKSREGKTMPRRKETTTYEEEEALKQKRIAEAKAKKEQKQTKAIPAFSPEEVTVVFVLGGPGAGKGTQCENLTKDYGFVHLSAGDLLRAEQKREGSKYGELINNYIREGLIVPMEVTIALLEQAMNEAIAQGKEKRFLIDGFPRKMDQAVKFEEVVVPSKLVLFFECPEEVMLKRLLKRGESSGRVDDNIESIKKRFRVFIETSMPVIEAFEKDNKVKKISCDQPVEQVYQGVKTIFDEMFAEKK
ncbi:adenylate kinase-domain-containing protein [Helicostylum pulchrum]|uniref:Uridylate kinase n=1 Tax=Helicostylum pulchrum TaxID=562976 RepID=A0ABP9XRQ7_9FUNG|nr:adenylate kinase-domain-containing protein [Helicostylum pulchrum]